MVSYVSALTDTEFTQLVADARGTDTRQAAADALRALVHRRSGRST